MTIEIKTGINIDSEFLSNYFKTLVNQFFKILPMREDNEESLQTYIEELQEELIGFSKLFGGIFEYDQSFISLISILQYMIDHPDCKVITTRRKVFRAISICNRLKAKFGEGGVSDGRC